MIIIVLQLLLSTFSFFRICGKVQGNEMKLKIATMFRELKRKIAIEVQEGEGRKQTGKSPTSYSLYV